MIQKLHQTLGPSRAKRALGKIHLIDSSTLSMCLNQYEWADFRETKAGIKMHTSIILCDDDSYLNDIILTSARPADETQLDALIVPDENALHIFDRGYFNFKKFDLYCGKDIRFVTRIKSNTIVTVIEELPVDPTSPIIRNAIVKIGNMKHSLGLVETLDSEGNKISIVCNDLEISAEEISDLYRSRWQIELFFKWVKQHLKNNSICQRDRKSTRLNSSHVAISYAVFCLKKKQ